MILVTGATGHLGNATINHLLTKTNPSNIIAFVRDEEKAKSLKEKGITIRQGSFDDSNSLGAAMQGVSRVLLISGTDPNRLEQHRRVIDAAKKAGVAQIVYTSVAMNDVDSSAIKDFMNDHFKTEEYIQASGIPFTILRNTLYMDGILLFAGEHVLETGINLPSGDGKVPYVLRREMGEAAANVLLENGHTNKIYDITGQKAHSYQDVADTLTELSGKKVAYTDAELNAFNHFLAEVGVPEIMRFIIAGFSTDIKHHQYEVTSSDLEHLLGRKPVGLKEGLKEILAL